MHKILQKFRLWWQYFIPKRRPYSQVILDENPIAYYRLNDVSKEEE